MSAYSASSVDMNKDYYEILGVNRNADARQIHQAYRRRARELHPDKNKSDPQAEEKFKDLGEAYRILSDPEKRKQYDMFGSVGGDFAPPPGWERGGVHFDPDDFEGFQRDGSCHHTGFEDLFDSLFRRFSGRSRDESTRSGKTRYSVQRGSDIEVEMTLTLEDLFSDRMRQFRIAITKTCEVCEGFGQTGAGSCRSCDGTGKSRKYRTFRVRIPKGFGDGDVIRLSGQGNPAPDGIGPAGDLLIRLRVKPDPHIRFHGHDLEMDVEVPDYQAALGGVIQFQAPSGKLSLRLPEGSASGKKLKVRGKGLPKKDGGSGDLYVNIVVAVPKKLNRQQKELYERLKQTSSQR